MNTTIKLTVLSLTLMLAAGSARADESQHSKPALRALSLIDQWLSKDQLIAAGIDSDGRALVDIALDASLPAYTRIRAASMLGVFDSEAARAGTRRILDTANVRPIEIKVQAIRAHAELEQLRARPKLEQLLADDQAELRAAAVRALAKLEVRTPLEARLPLEREAWVRALIVKKLGH